MSTRQDREQMLAQTFVELADTLVADFDVVDFLHGLADQCMRLLDADAAGLMLAGQRWPSFAPAAADAGFASVQALPMRDEVIGAMNLFRAAPGGL